MYLMNVGYVMAKTSEKKLEAVEKKTQTHYVIYEMFANTMYKISIVFCDNSVRLIVGLSIFWLVARNLH